MIFRIGQKVVCVDASTPFGGHGATATLTEGAIYTIRDLGLTAAGAPGVRLFERELTNRPGHVGHVTGQPFKDSFYRGSRFRPLIEKTTSTGFAILEEIRDRESEPMRPKQPALTSTL